MLKWFVWIMSCRYRLVKHEVMLRTLNVNQVDIKVKEAYILSFDGCQFQIEWKGLECRFTLAKLRNFLETWILTIVAPSSICFHISIKLQTFLTF